MLHNYIISTSNFLLCFTFSGGTTAEYPFHCTLSGDTTADSKVTDRETDKAVDRSVASLENELLLFYSEGDEASDRVTDKAASYIEKKRQNKTSDTASSFALVKANKRPTEQATKRPQRFKEK
jgi:hypothetical protein